QSRVQPIDRTQHEPRFDFIHRHVAMPDERRITLTGKWRIVREMIVTRAAVAAMNVAAPLQPRPRRLREAGACVIKMIECVSSFLKRIRRAVVGFVELPDALVAK